MRFSLNTIGLFPGLTFDEIFPQMRQSGFDTFELWSLDNTDTSALREAMDRHGVRLSAFCPSFFILNDRARQDEYIDSLRRALQTARALSCPALITQVGQDTGAPREEQHAAILSGLRRAAPLLEEAEVTLLVEPLNSVKDHKGYYLTDSLEGFALVEETGSPRVRLLYDVYHQLHMGEDVLERIEAHLPLIGHFHIAGFPNRDAALFDGGFDYRKLFDLLRRMDAQAPVGVELFLKDAAQAPALLAQLLPFA
ncbi:MAG: TIM barrel protein [Candidatus Spyradocola sp.]|jgi:hydroxypyruvate isomerase